ncbi:MAG: DUF2703 domain-containing protein [Candidatus Micrarchaeota archaeon]|nr:DUF2703 domain-containing protein [Candidatus Micrarchaeota archaeon]
MLKHLTIEFLYVDRSSCSRCRKSYENARKAYAKLKRELAKSGINVRFKARKIPLSKLQQSNSVRINGKDLWALLKTRKTSKPAPTSRCYGCSKLKRKPCECRAYYHKGRKLTGITQSMIREAVMSVLWK